MTEVLLRQIGPGVFSEHNSAADPPNEIRDADRELLAAYVERRLSWRGERAVRRRLSAEPPFRDALADLIAAARGTEYGDHLLAEPVAEPAATSRPRKSLADAFAIWRWRLAPALSVAAAFLVIAVAGGIWWKMHGSGGAALNAVNRRLAEIATLRQRGEIDQARRGYLELAAAPAVPESKRQEVVRALETLTVEVAEQYRRQRAFQQAAAVAEQALAVAPQRPALQLEVADAQLQAWRQSGGWPTELGVERPPMATRVIEFEDPKRAAALDRIFDVYRQVQERDPKNVRALLGQAEIHIAKRELDQANQALARAQQVSPNDPAVQNALGRLFYQKGEDGLAQQAFRRALELDPTNAPPRINLDTLFGPRRKQPSTGLAPLVAPPSAPSPSPQQPGKALDRLFEKQK